MAVVLNLQTSGPLLLRALISQDMYLAGAFVLLLSTLTVIGTLISDILLAWLIRASGWRARRYGDRKHHRCQHPGGRSKKAGSAEQIYVAPQWKLMYWKFRKHRMAVASVFVLAIFYLVALFCEFVAPYDPEAVAHPLHQRPADARAPVRFERQFRGPFIYGSKRDRDPNTLRPIFAEDKSADLPDRDVRARRALQAVGALQRQHPPVRHRRKARISRASSCSARIGSGAIMFSRVAYGARISLSIGLVGVLLSLILGIVLGGISGYYGGIVDTIIQRVIEFIRSIPAIPLWMALAAALPANWPHPGLLRHHDHPLADRLDRAGARGARAVPGAARGGFRDGGAAVGASEMRIILRHMVPSFLSYIIAALTLAIPGMILAETGAELPGPGAAPAGDQLGRAAARRPEPALGGAGALGAAARRGGDDLVLAFNFLGDGLRDAADPYSK